VPIRLAQLADLPPLMAMFRRVIPPMHEAGNMQWSDDYPTDAIFARDIEAGDLWVAEAEDATLTGVAAYTTAPAHEYAAAGWDIHEPSIFTHRLAVDPGYRGAGIAVSLMQQAEQIACDRGIRVLRVDTSLQNLPAQRLIVRLGYTFVAEIPLEVRPGLRVRCYEKRLGDCPQSGPR
jgi:GNAT superfamily N-acetyltransferase